MKHLPYIHLEKFDIKNANVTEVIKEELMDIEKRCFLSMLRMDWEDKEFLLGKSVSCFLAYNTKIEESPKIIGEIYALDSYEEEAVTDDDRHFLEIMKRCKEEDGAYVYSIGVLPRYEGKDIGKRLLMNLLIDLKEKGYKKIFAHAKKGASEHLFKFFEGKVLGYRDNWYETKMIYAIIEVDLESLFLTNVHPYKQDTGYDCGLSCMEVVLDYRGIKFERDKLIKDSGMTKVGTLFDGIVNALKEAGAKAKEVKNFDELILRLSYRQPCILCVLSAGCYEGHYIVATGLGADSVYCMDVSLALFGRMSFEEVNRVWWNNITKSKQGVAI